MPGLAFRTALDVPRQPGVLDRLQAIVEEPFQLLLRRAVDSWAVSFEFANLYLQHLLHPPPRLNTAATSPKKTGRSGVFILGGGSPKNFILQTEPQIQKVLGLDESGHDYFLQVTDARPDTGGLSGATPSEAMTWGKVDPEMLPDTVTCYLDSTVALPLITAYALGDAEPRTPRG